MKIEVWQKLYDITEKEQNCNSRLTGFGTGFYRWVASVDIADALGITYSAARVVLRQLVSEGKAQGSKRVGGQYCFFSLTGWDDCTIKGDYFIETTE